MKHDTLTHYVNLRNALTTEKAEIEQRLQQLNGALGQADASDRQIRQGSPLPFSATSTTRGRGRGSNSMTLKEAIIQVTSALPLSRKEIVDAVQKAGYRFNSKNPLNLLGGILYGKNPRFRNADGKYSPMGKPVDLRSQGTSSGTIAARPSPHLGRSGKRTMGPEQKAKLAAAARKRWRIARAAGRTSL